MASTADTDEGLWALLDDMPDQAILGCTTTIMPHDDVLPTESEAPPKGPPLQWRIAEGLLGTLEDEPSPLPPLKLKRRNINKLPYKRPSELVARCVLVRTINQEKTMQEKQLLTSHFLVISPDVPRTIQYCCLRMGVTSMGIFGTIQLFVTSGPDDCPANHIVFRDPPPFIWHDNKIAEEFKITIIMKYGWPHASYISATPKFRRIIQRLERHNENA